MAPAAPVRFFHISPEWCGQDRLASIFQRNGVSVSCHENGALAEDIFHAQASNRAPLTAWTGTRLCTGLYRNGPVWRPPLQGWRQFSFLHRYFPDAVFITTRRDPDEWLVDRLLRDGGLAARCYARHFGLSTEQVPALWLAEWQAHQQEVEQHFKDDPRLICLDLERHSPQDVAELLEGFIDLPQRIWGVRWHPALTSGQLSKLETLLDSPPDHSEVPQAVVDDIVQFCTKGLTQERTNLRGVSALYTHWDGRKTTHGHTGHEAGLAFGTIPETGRPIALSPAATPYKQTRAEGVINEVLALDRALPLQIDMEDSRWFDRDGSVGPGQPVLCHNRRQGTENVVLWPLPGLHDVTSAGFDAATPADPIAFQDKLDQVYWRGMISGHLMADGPRPGPPSFHFLDRLKQAEGDQTARQQAWDGLSRTSRLAFVREWFDHPDFDLGVVMAWGFREHAADPLLAPYCKPRAGRDQMIRYRYQLCLAGYDHGSNFISAINSNSVLFKEDDGWEVFYSGRFKPWIHFIPIERYGGDIAEKLAWARKNVYKCNRMSESARAEVALLGNPVLRRKVLEQILDVIAASG